MPKFKQHPVLKIRNAEDAQTIWDFRALIENLSNNLSQPEDSKDDRDRSINLIRQKLQIYLNLLKFPSGTIERLIINSSNILKNLLENTTNLLNNWMNKAAWLDWNSTIEECLIPKDETEFKIFIYVNRVIDIMNYHKLGYPFSCDNILELFNVLIKHKIRITKDENWELIKCMILHALSYKSIKPTTFKSIICNMGLMEIHEFPNLILVLKVGIFELKSRLSGAQLSEIFYVLVNLKISDSSLSILIMDTILIRKKDLRSHDMMLIIWSCTTLQLFSTTLFEWFYTYFKNHFQNFTPREISTLMWSFASFGYPVPLVLQLTAEKTLQSMTDFTIKDLINVVWALSIFQYPDLKFYEKVANFLIDKVETINPLCVSNLVYSLARMDVIDPSLLYVLGNQIKNQIHRFSARHIGVIAWGYAKFMEKNESLFEILSERAIGLMKFFEPQDLSYITWAYGILNIKDELLFENLSQQIVKHISKFQKIDIIMINVGYGKIGKLSPFQIQSH